ncbi:hypothetical protein P691DRAFT_685722 [Macrolepiota fuliginosa MF-IS2]|uniref:Uncharacterized protein n=1 Tax=Macrolepiota fuliginosa MF-IS2 TaxID=1400762 RepID=A0A9P6BWW8_9AGAR|nr:hypothetical protein P691DRAFT_685722 [Macrolepiota fuliginosa MF-IS2]
MMIFVGMIIAALFNGGLLTLGINCIFLLRPMFMKSLRQRRFWGAYIVILLLANLGYLTAYFLWGSYWIFFASNPEKRSKASVILTTICNVVPVVIVSMTDGVLAWRCYMVEMALGRSSSKFSKVFFISPLCLWAMTMGAGLVRNTRDYLNFISSALETTALASNILLNLYTTIFIATRLLLHRRMVIACFGTTAPTNRHLQIVTILLESAAINVPVTIIAATGLVIDTIPGKIAIPIAFACQSFASVLILHQVAVGRTVEDGTELSGNRNHSVSTWVLEQGSEG